MPLATKLPPVVVQRTRTALVLMDEEVRALAAGAHLMVGEAGDERARARLDRAAAVPLPVSLVRGVVNAVELF